MEITEEVVAKLTEIIENQKNVQSPTANFTDEQMSKLADKISLAIKKNSEMENDSNEQKGFYW